MAGWRAGNKYFTDSIDYDTNTSVKDYDKFQVHFAAGNPPTDQQSAMPDPE